MINKYSVEAFMDKLLKLEVIELLGVARIMNIGLYLNNDKEQPKDGADILIEMCEKYKTYSRAARKNLMKIIG
jgi:hypothetical protein